MSRGLGDVYKRQAAERKAQAGGYGLAAYDAAGKQEAIDGEAGPDYDEPA